MSTQPAYHRHITFGVAVTVIIAMLSIAMMATNPYPDQTGAAGGALSAVRSDGTILYQGQPFFLYGFNHDSGGSSQTNLNTAITKIADANFNGMYIQPSEHWSTAMTNATDRGLKLILDGDGASDNGFPGVIQAYKGKENVIGWGAADDFNSIWATKTYDWIADRVTTIMANDSTRPTFMSGSGYAGYNPIGYMDNTSPQLIGIQTYPIGDNTTNIGEVYEYMSRMVPAANARGKALIAQLQTFKWDGSRLPTGQEVKNMTYQAIVAGVNGILYYTFQDYGNWNLGNNGLWNEVSLLPQEINPLIPALLNGTYTSYTSNATYNSGKKLVAASWDLNGKKYLIIVNASNQSRTETISIPNLSGTFTPLYNSTPQNVNITAGNNSFTLGSQQVMVLTQEASSGQPPIDPNDCGSMDTNSDNKLNVVDLSAFASRYGKVCVFVARAHNTCGARDVNGDGRISAADLGKFSQNYQKPACQ